MRKCHHLREFWDDVIYRPLALKVIDYTLHWKITANHWTAIAALQGPVVAAYCYTNHFIMAAIHVFLFNVLDCVDGAWARQKGEASAQGEVFDMIGDIIFTTFCLIGALQLTILPMGIIILFMALTIKGAKDFNTFKNKMQAFSQGKNFHSDAKYRYYQQHFSKWHALPFWVPPFVKPVTESCPPQFTLMDYPRPLTPTGSTWLTIWCVLMLLQGIIS